MCVKTVILFVGFFFSFLFARSQTCTTAGQNPSTAFPVCGTSVFSQSTVPYCGGAAVPGPCSTTDSLTDTNPFWYKFTCFKAGTLGFLITPQDMNDDYDWQLFDVTGRNPNDIYTDISLFVACNWSGNTGLTGASAADRSLQNCAGTSYPTFSAMPVLKLNHEYLLLVSHFTKFTPSQLGYQLSFGGGTGSITDTTQPALKAISSSCDETKLYIKLNKNMKCASLAANGSDFTLSSPVASIISATTICNGFDMDSLVLGLSNPLPSGDYTLTIKNGSDGNTLLDVCGRNIPVGDTMHLKVLPLAPTPMDSLTALKCAPNSLQLVFAKNILCNSVATDGSDFTVTGPTNVTITGATTNCVNAVAKSIILNLATPIVTGGTYRIILKNGTDGNTIFDECAEQTPAGSTLSFTIKDTVSADFSYRVNEGCKKDTVYFFQDAKNGINQWTWQLDYNGVSTLQNPVTNFDPSGKRKITLVTSNGFCSDTLSKTIDLGDKLAAAFEASAIVCPEDSAVFKNLSTGRIASYFWDFKNGSTSMDMNPYPQKYPALITENTYQVSLGVRSNIGCEDTVSHTIRVLKSCYIAVPNAFSPNGDGLNDFLYPLNAFKADKLEFRVYNRLGQLVFKSNDWTQKWDGTIKGEPQDTGIYVWTLKYINHDTGKPVSQKGSTVLIR
jgi:gliding motility-associated-like protein